MDIDNLKGKTIDDKLHAELSAHVAELSSQRDAARKESIDGRKGKDARIKELGDRLTAFAERLGVEPDADLESLPTAKGQAEAAKQFEAQIKKLTRERDEAAKGRDDLTAKLAGEKRERVIAEAVAKHDFIDSSDARTLIAARVRQEGDDFLFEADGGKLVPVADGAAWLAKTKPYSVKAAGGGGGSGFKGSGGGGQGPNPFDPKTFNLTQQIAMAKENPVLAQQLKAAATPVAA
jgi:hypothetical protein